LFSPDRARTPARVLSGGERNRLLLARLFTKPANVLVMDEPTNDLDAETLDLLEELLVEYKGTLIVVSHDRDFLDNVVTSSLVFEGDGRIEEYVGGYSDWLREREKAAARAAAASAAAAVAASAVVGKAAASAARAPRGRSLNAREQKELAALPGRIETIEAEQQTVAAQLADPRFYQRETAAVVSAAKARVMELDQEHATAFARWEELEAMRVAAEA
jgi:ATP-binding cassette subfamily F protein uup